tara:strand:- start:49 stop:477 length:429 start_codon:yes stop_codon:yes gene_type:complete
VFNFLKKKTGKESKIKAFDLSKIASLLIHVAKIDENYTENEKNIIKKTLIELGEKENIDLTMKIAEENESNSNQILEFTREFKYLDDNSKEKIIESLWNVIYSDSNSDMYEETLMRRLTGLLYLDKKLVGDLKDKVKKKIKK